MKQVRNSYVYQKEFSKLLMQDNHTQLMWVMQLCEMISRCRGILMDIYSSKELEESYAPNEKFFCAMYSINPNTIITLSIEESKSRLSNIVTLSKSFKFECMNDIVNIELGVYIWNLLDYLAKVDLDLFYKDLDRMLIIADATSS